ncbi:MAG TPA: hypothetical protein VF192_01055 [Longimicrobiales bacterium]
MAGKNRKELRATVRAALASAEDLTTGGIARAIFPKAPWDSPSAMDRAVTERLEGDVGEALWALKTEGRIVQGEDGQWRPAPAEPAEPKRRVRLHWEDALEEQVRLMNFWRTDLGRNFAIGFAKDVKDKGRDWSAEFFAATPHIESPKLERAEPVHVDSNVVRLIQTALDSPGFKPEPLDYGDLFTPEGFALLDEPIHLRDVNGVRTSVRAFSWGPVIFAREDTRETEMQLHVALYSHLEDEDDYSAQLRADFAEGRTLAELARVWRANFGSLLSMYHAGAIRWGEVPDPDDREAWAVGEGPYNPSSMHMFIQAFFRLAEQRILAVSRFQGNRASRKRLARLRHDKDGVLVVRLRREKEARREEGEGAVEWSCQWPVSGHWRSQWYPSKGEHRQIWIDGYVKGPADKPLRVHAGRAFEFTR